MHKQSDSYKFLVLVYSLALPGEFHGHFPLISKILTSVILRKVQERMSSFLECKALPWKLQVTDVIGALKEREEGDS